MKSTKGWKIVMGIATLGSVVIPFVGSAVLMTVMLLQMPNLMDPTSPSFMVEFYRAMLPSLAV